MISSKSPDILTINAGMIMSNIDPEVLACGFNLQ